MRVLVGEVRGREGGWARLGRGQWVSVGGVRCLDPGRGFRKESIGALETLREGGKNQGCLPGPGPGCLVDGDREPWVGMLGPVVLAGLLAGTSLSQTLSLPGSPRLTHFWFAPLGFGWAAGSLGELHPGEGRLERGCTGVLLKQSFKEPRKSGKAGPCWRENARQAGQSRGQSWER